MLLKRGYLTHALLRQVDAARAHAVRARQAKLAVELLLRVGRPSEAVVRAFHEDLRARGYAQELPHALAAAGHLAPQDVASLRAAVERGLAMLHRREAEELAGLINAGSGAIRRSQAVSALAAGPPPASSGAIPAVLGPGPIGGETAVVPGPIAPPAPPPEPSPYGYPPAAHAAPPPHPAAPPPHPRAGPTAVMPLPPPFPAPGGAGAGRPAPLPPPVDPFKATRERPIAPNVGAAAAANVGFPAAGAARLPDRADRSRAPPAGAPGKAPPPATPAPWMPQTPVPADIGGRDPAIDRTGAYRPVGNDPTRAHRAAPPVDQTGAYRPVKAVDQTGAHRPAVLDRTGGGKPVDRDRTGMRPAVLDRTGGYRPVGGGPAPPAPADEPPPGMASPSQAASAVAPAPRLKKEALAEPTGPIPGYEIVERIGRGTVGVVYKARELATGRDVALKILLPVFLQNQTLVERFRREATIAASLDHPNIRRIYAGGEAGGFLYLAMEFVDGETLQDRIDRHGSVPEPEALRVVAQVARAMDHYVKLGVLHRDMKPANILVSRSGTAKLCDLGISKRVYEDFALTVQGTTLGSPFYISPEQGLGTDNLDVRSDIYSLGVTLFHALAGRVPFIGGNAGVIISKHHREPLPDISKLKPGLSKGCVKLIGKMCGKRPEERHQSARELLAEITWVRAEHGASQTPIVPLTPPRPDEAAAAAAAAATAGARRPGLLRRILRLFGKPDSRG